MNVRTALREKKRAPSTSILCRVGSIGQRCNETMFTRDAVMDVSEADMNSFRGADKKNCVTSSAVSPCTQANLKPFEFAHERPNQARVFLGAARTHVRCRGRRCPSTHQPSV